MNSDGDTYACLCGVAHGWRLTRRHRLANSAGMGLMPAIGTTHAGATLGATPGTIDLAAVAIPTASTISGGSALHRIVDASTPASSGDVASGLWAAWYNAAPQWLELRWPAPIGTDHVEVYWGDDGEVLGLPRSARILYWDGARFVPVSSASALGVAGDRFNPLSFAAVRTDRLRLEMDASKNRSVAVMRWRVHAAGEQPRLPAIVDAGIDRTVVLGGATYLSARADWLARHAGDTLRWSKESGPGDVRFADPAAAETSATVSAVGDYVLRLTALSDGSPRTSTVRVRAVPPPPPERLDVVYTTPYAVDSPLWNDRVRALIVEWIPHVIATCERTDLPTGQGGIDNFVEAAKALRGEPHGAHKGYVFSNAWVHQTVESMCLALMVDPGQDAAMKAAQDGMRATLDRWIPIILAAQEPDGYLQTAYTLADRELWPARWIPAQRTGHEGYVGGYFIESAINHHMLTGGRDLRLYDAAKKLADCWVAHIGPGKKTWYDGHQEMEQALVRFGRFVNDVEGAGAAMPMSGWRGS